MGDERIEGALAAASRFILNCQAVPVDKQWEQVQALHEAIPDLAPGDHGWHIIESWGHSNTPARLPPDFPRGAELRVIDDTPMAVMFWFLGAGMHPPPELTISLLNTWEGYLYGAGSYDLERAFNGAPIKKAGNFAQRSDYQKKVLWMFKEMDRLVAAGMRREDAAEDISVRLGGTPSSDSILRTLKKFRLVSGMPDQNGSS